MGLEVQVHRDISKLLNEYVWNKEFYSIRNLLLASEETFTIVRFEIETFHKDSEEAMKALEEVKEIYPERWI